ncbi:MAG TPA: NHL repeat-containing protein [Steroidobacteraceae bacterium]|nr:NHL repeat-containing protein [Steroidobacteraceae bacterium]
MQGTAMRIVKVFDYPKHGSVCVLAGLMLAGCGGGASNHSASSTPAAAPTAAVKAPAESNAPEASATATAPSFVSPVGLAVNSVGEVYVADYGNNLIRKISPTGVVRTLAGSRSQGDADGIGSAASFYYPESVALDSAGNVFVADHDNNQVRKITPAGAVTTLAGSGEKGDADGSGRAATFDGPEGVAVDKSGNVYVADYGNNAIRKITPAGVVTTLAGLGAPGNADGTGSAASFNGPEGVAVDNSGNVYVADYGNNAIRKVTPAGAVTTLAGSGAQGNADGHGRAASFNGPEGVAVDSAGDVYVADYGNNEIRKITPAGVVTTLAGSGAKGAADGTGRAASFDGPEGIAVDSAGNVYVGDEFNNEIRKVSTAGVVTTLAVSGAEGDADVQKVSPRAPT